MTVFALVHGAWGVPAEWHGVVRALRALGHQGVAVDLPITDPRAGLDDYAAAVVHAVEPVAEPVVVVGQSAGGYTAALVAARRSVSHVVYLTAFVPRPGHSFLGGAAAHATAGDDSDAAAVSPAFAALVVDAGCGCLALDVRGLAVLLAGEAAADDAVPLLSPLLRPNGRRPFEEPWPLAALPHVPATYLLGAADAILPPAAQRRFAARLGVEPIEIPGADHGVHGRRPQEVAQLLVQAVRTG